MRGDPHRRGRVLLVVGVVLMLVGLGTWVLLSGSDRKPGAATTPSTVITTTAVPTQGELPGGTPTPAPGATSSPAPVTVTVPSVAQPPGAGSSVLGQLTALLGALTGLILAVTGLIQLLRTAKKT